ncbi:response regulator transcription factor [Nitrospina watsonii]|uniref:Response regulatory domain-containing protein n=1 Tax=Nitrospina watsonii TaxID=1323948 RepID=A0ABN8W3X2_9BACT|nr:response regulator [Nitrospina watsonii]CAI2718331.1 Response regulatory domain-containing protein [Nitrospina watsonii]
MTNPTNNPALSRVTAADILKVIPITRKTLWLWQKKYNFFPDPIKEAHPGGKGIVGYYPAWVKERCKRVYELQKSGYTIAMIKDILKKETEEKSSRKILVVDDEKKFTSLVQKFLEKDGYLVEVAGNGLDAGLKAADFLPSIMLLDINLPGLNGLEVCSNLKNNPKTAFMTIIVISASTEYSEQQVQEAGGDLFIRKPVDLTDLLEKCNAILDENTANP